MPRSFRIVCRPEHVGLVEELLRAEGHVFEPEPFYGLARRVREEPSPLGASVAAAFGLIYIQDRSSMLAPLLLRPPAGAMVLDMCASPGSKTGLLAQLAGPSGMVLANEPNPRRLATLRQNLATLNLAQTVTCSYPGQDLPLPEGYFSHIQLDPPCSGWGTAERNPRVREMWPEHKLGPLISLQRKLLRKAASLLAPGGRLLYSTCTTNPAENLEQVEWARTELGLSSIPLGALPGFESSRELCQAGEGCLQVQAEAGEGQGFFFAALARPLSEGSSRFPEPDAAWERSGRLLQPRAFAGLEQAAWDRLPPGELREFSGRVLFLPRQATALPRSLRWQGFELGRLQGKTLRLNPRLRLLLPEYAEDRGQNIEDLGELTRLLKGQSLALPADAPGSHGRIGLYWRGLPLGWATLKGRRCLWSAR